MRRQCPSQPRQRVQNHSIAALLMLEKLSCRGPNTCEIVAAHLEQTLLGQLSQVLPLPGLVPLPLTLGSRSACRIHHLLSQGIFRNLRLSWASDIAHVQGALVRALVLLLLFGPSTVM
jgi:hypothetical protein